MLYIGGTGGGICNVRYPGSAALVCLLAAVLCGSPATVCPYPMSTAPNIHLTRQLRVVPGEPDFIISMLVTKSFPYVHLSFNVILISLKT